MRVSARLGEIIAHHTGQPFEKVTNDTDRDYFMSGGEGVQHRRPRHRAPLKRPLLLVLLAFAVPPSPPVAAASGDGATEFSAHVFPVAGTHWTRGYIGEFGVPRSGGRTHEGFDIVAACQTPLVAAATGPVLRAGYDPVLYGNYLLIHGQAERRSYFYSHLARPAAVDRGDRVWAGQRVGAVGKTGNARAVGCHLHFEIHQRGRPVDPESFLERWGREEFTFSAPYVASRCLQWQDDGDDERKLDRRAPGRFRQAHRSTLRCP